MKRSTTSKKSRTINEYILKYAGILTPKQITEKVNKELSLNMTPARVRERASRLGKSLKIANEKEKVDARIREQIKPCIGKMTIKEMASMCKCSHNRIVRICEEDGNLGIVKLYGKNNTAKSRVEPKVTGSVVVDRLTILAAYTQTANKDFRPRYI